MQVAVMQNQVFPSSRLDPELRLMGGTGLPGARATAVICVRASVVVVELDEPTGLVHALSAKPAAAAKRSPARFTCRPCRNPPWGSSANVLLIPFTSSDSAGGGKVRVSAPKAHVTGSPNRRTGVTAKWQDPTHLP